MKLRQSIILGLCLIGGLGGLKAQEKSPLHQALESTIDYVVASDGSGDYTTLQQAVNAAPSNSSEEIVIFMKKGIYREKVEVPSSKSHLTLIGEDADSTVVVWDDYAGRIVDGVELNTFTSWTIRIDAPDFKAINLCFENDARPNGSGDGQNVAVSSYGDRNIFLHCRMIAWQDTYYSGSDDRQYFKDCYIEGAVDYIFGHSTVIFDSCQIHTVRSGGYITAASTEEDHKYGYVFRHCNLTSPPGEAGVYLGRPWKNHPRTVFYECEEYSCIRSTGWRVWGGTENTSFYAEYNCTGPGSDTSNRVDWSHQLTPGQAANYTMENIFSAASSSVFSKDWDPAVESDTLWSIVQTFTLAFMSPEYTDARIAELLVDGEILPGWNPDTLEYSIELDPEQPVMPVLEAQAVSPLATVKITYPESLPGFSEILVLAADSATNSSYRIYLSVNGSYTDTRLDSIIIANGLMEEFDPDVLEYDLILPEGTSKYFGLTGYAHVKAAKVKSKRPDSFPGLATVTVTAVDLKTVATYVLNLSLATSVEDQHKAINSLPAVRTANGSVVFDIQLELPAQLSIKILDINGRILHRSDQGSYNAGKHQINVLASLPPGAYIYTIEDQGILWSGKFVK